MTYRANCLILIVLCTVGLMPLAAQAQWYGVPSARPAPLYPYQLQPGQSYAVEIAPGAYVIHRPASRDYPYVRYPAGWRHVAPRHATRHHAARGHVARRQASKRHVAVQSRERIVINTKKAEHGAPRRNGDTRVIHADAEVTILGPDRINIRLYRKRSAEADNAFDRR